MASVEQTAIIKAPLPVVMDALNDVESIPSWATVTGTIDNVQGAGVGMTYCWHYTINDLRFSGESEVVVQTDSTLVTKTTGDIDSIWTITLTPAGVDSTIMRVVVEYTHPDIYIELLADLVLAQLNDPEVAHENMNRFRKMVEARTKAAAEAIVANPSVD